MNTKIVALIFVLVVLSVLVSSGGAWSQTVVDSYSESNQDVDLYVSEARTGRAQSFTSTDGGTLDNVVFYIKKYSSPTGYAHAKIYAHSGTYGTSSLPGALLATSDSIDVSTWSTYALIEFTFSGAERITLSASTYYIVSFEYVHATAGAYLNMGGDNSSQDHDGNSMRLEGTWATVTEDLCFYVYSAATGVDTCCTITTSPVAFGSVDTAAVDTIAFTITNCGTDTYGGTVVAADLAAPFSMVESGGDLVWSLAATEIDTFHIIFSPTAVVASYDTLGAGHDSCAVIYISGTGAEPSEECSGSVLDVCKSGCTYSTLSSAAAAASSCDTIEIQDSGEYDEYWTLAADNVYLRHAVGERPRLTYSTDDADLLSLVGDSCTIDSIWFANTPGYAQISVHSDYNTIKNCRFDSAGTGGFEDGQSGLAVLIGKNVAGGWGSSYNVVSDCYFGDGGHDALALNGYGTDSTQFNQILNNTIHNRFGHGISLLNGTVSYNLIEGNIISGDSLSGDRNSKNLMQISGSSNNTIRRNVFYHSWNRAFEINMYPGLESTTTDNNWFYNNTFWNIGYRDDDGGDNPSNFGVQVTTNRTDSDIVGNKFYNNIFAKIGQTEGTGTSWPPSDAYTMWKLGYLAGGAGVDTTALYTTNDWNGNILKNNCIRMYHNGDGGAHTADAYHLDCDEAIGYYSSVGGTLAMTWTVEGVNSKGSMADNFTSDPLLDDTTTVWAGWWHIPINSPCVDAGTALINQDVNANHGGWDTLAWSGTAPDVGAYEVAAATDTCCTVYNLAFGSVYVDSTAVDSFRIYNCGDMTLIDTLAYSTWDAAYVLSTPADSAYSIATGETEWFVVEFTPVATTSYPDTNAVGDEACADNIIFSGTGLTNTCCSTIAPPYTLWAFPTMLFGSVYVDSTATDSFYIKNCGYAALVDSIDWENMLSVFTLTSDSLYNITAGDSVWFTVEFTPTATGLSIDTLYTGHDDCANVMLTGTALTNTCCSVLTSPIAFGETYLDSTLVDSFYIKNCLYAALVDSIDWVNMLPVFTLTSDSLYNIAAGDSM